MLITDIVKILTDSGIAENEANIEVRLLIEKFAGFNLIDIITGKKLDEGKLKIVEEKAKLRARTREPIQYIIGEADFMGEKFFVNPSVLIPRDETEILVTKAVEIINKNNFKSVLDMCTGSGCIACMIAKIRIRPFSEQIFLLMRLKPLLKIWSAWNYLIEQYSESLIFFLR